MSASDERHMTPLEAAMASSFVYDPEAVENKVDVAPASPAARVSTDAPPADTTTQSSEEELAEDQTDWRDEYDQRLTEWRAAASVSREKAERERAKWEAIREEEAKNGISRPPFPDTPASAAPPSSSVHSTLSMSGWQSVGGESTLASSTVSITGPGDSPSPADARDLVTGEQRGGHGAEVLQVLGPRPTAPERVSTAEAAGSGAVTTDEDSGKSASHWENLPSLASSFPSLPSHPRSSPPTKSKEQETKTPPPSQARSITLLLFDSATSTRTRLLALTATLGINLLLPFINGVMIGFGEIAAKSIVNWWRTGRALSATAAGMRTAHPIV